MHYRNGRAAVNGDKIVSLNGGEVVAAGTLYDAVPGNDYCNGHIMVGYEQSGSDPVACMCDCLHVDDLAAILAEKGLGNRPDGM
ncbi:MAG: hypothetical protein OEY66_07170 [Gammaproteobacteria bacterium]|nr:hypothetical protein [Gammaproteobacteria bacterium]